MPDSPFQRLPQHDKRDKIQSFFLSLQAYQVKKREIWKEQSIPYN